MSGVIDDRQRQQIRLRFAVTCLDGRRIPLNAEQRAERKGEFAYWGANGIVDYLDEYLFDEPLVLLGEDGAPFFDPFKDKAFYVTDRVWVNNHIHALSPKKGFDGRYLVYALNVTDYSPYIEGSTRDKLTQDSLKEIRISCPSNEDRQRRIAAYLDAETHQMGALVAEKEAMLKLLEEKRAAQISHAVTRGLNPRAPLKPSALPWLGDIPKHWETRRCANLFEEIDVRGEPELPLLLVSINTGVTLRVFSDDRIESTAEDFNSYKVARQGQLAFNKMRFWQGAAGIAPVDGLVSPDYTVATVGHELDPHWIEHLFRLPLFSSEVRRHSHGIVDDRLRLYWEGFRDIRIPVPPLAEQRAIVAHLASERERTAELETALRQSIQLLQERRRALITAAVTGQIDPVSET